MKLLCEMFQPEAPPLSSASPLEWCHEVLLLFHLRWILAAQSPNPVLTSPYMIPPDWTENISSCYYALSAPVPPLLVTDQLITCSPVSVLSTDSRKLWSSSFLLDKVVMILRRASCVTHKQACFTRTLSLSFYNVNAESLKAVSGSKWCDQKRIVALMSGILSLHLGTIGRTEDRTAIFMPFIHASHCAPPQEPIVKIPIHQPAGSSRG